MFGKSNINFQAAKTFLIDMLDGKDIEVNTDSNNVFEVNVKQKSRVISIKLYFNKKLVVDINDSWFSLRIPKTEFKSMDKYKDFIVKSVNQI